MAAHQHKVVHNPPLAGIIVAVTRIGRPGCYGLVALDTPYEGFDRAVINDETKGRIALMNPTGQLEAGQKVQIRETSRGPESHLILKVSAA